MIVATCFNPPLTSWLCFVLCLSDILCSSLLYMEISVQCLNSVSSSICAAIFDNTGQYVITGSDDRLVKIWSTETGLCLRSCRGHEVFPSKHAYLAWFLLGMSIDWFWHHVRDYPTLLKRYKNTWLNTTYTWQWHAWWVKITSCMHVSRVKAWADSGGNLAMLCRRMSCMRL